MLEFFVWYLDCVVLFCVIKFFVFVFIGQFFRQFWTLLDTLDTLDTFGQFWTLWTVLDALDSFGRFWTVLTALDGFGQFLTVFAFGHFWTLEFLLPRENGSIVVGHVLSSFYIEAVNCWQFTWDVQGAFFTVQY